MQLTGANKRWEGDLAALTERDVSPHERPVLGKYKAFVLTIDNVLKMNAVFCRVSAGVPVVVMGETGCGKTFSIGFLAAFLGYPFCLRPAPPPPGPSKRPRRFPP